MAGSAQATVHFSLSSACVDDGASGSTAAGNTCVFVPSSGTVSAVGSAWASTRNSGVGGAYDDLLERAVIHDASSNDAGVRWVDTDQGAREGIGSPDHSLDNTKVSGGSRTYGEVELILFDFGTDDVNLEGVDVSWKWGSNAKFSVLAYTGTEPFDPDVALDGVKLTVDEEELTSVGWEVVSTVTATTGVNDISGDSEGIFTSKWVVSAYSAEYDNGSRTKGGVKVSGVKGTFDEPGGGDSIPLPATLFLMAGALPWLRRRGG